MTILGKRIILIFAIFVISFHPLQIHANDEIISLNNETINPGSFYYPFKRLWEKFREKLTIKDQAKISFNESLVKKRLSELNYVVEKKVLSEVQYSSERFAYQAGMLTEELTKQNKNEDKEKFVKEFEKYSQFLEGVRDKYQANSAYWLLIQHDINTLNILSERLK